ncbi:MAG: formylglycine-generating enzyme family protein [Anaerolineae bacterium]|nr:formylglycine-generating enzyme family protein [Anaerolineae bacterium]
MAGLTRQTMRAIAKLLIPLMQSEPDARAILRVALGDAPVIDRIDFRGAPSTYVINLIQTLVDHGEIEPGVPALWAVLDAAQAQLGADKQARIAALRPEIMALAGGPAAPPPAPSVPAAPAGAAGGDVVMGDKTEHTATAEGDIAIAGSSFGDHTTIVGGDLTQVKNLEIENLVINVRGDGSISATEVKVMDIMDLLRLEEGAAPLPAALALSGKPLAFEPLWVLVPPGSFTMGSSAGDRLAFDDEMPQHSVRMRRPYLISQTPVTNEQYKAFVRTSRRRSPKHWQRGGDVPDHPVTWVSWQDAMDYCTWLTGALREAGRFPAEADVRVKLPTEAQWERAARGDADPPLIYPWGEAEPGETRLNFNKGKDAGGTTPVDQYPAGASPFGCLDMAGNVWEWTLSMEKSYPYDPDDGRESIGMRARRTLRGGAFDSSARNVRCATRNWNYPEARDDTIGFRVVLVWG